MATEGACVNAADEQHLCKEPWLAVNLSFLVPGLGQFYARAWAWGVFFLLGAGLVSFSTAWEIFSPRGKLVFALGLAVVGALFGIANICVAHRCAKKTNSALAERARKQSKDPHLAVFLTQILPGVGHLYLRRWPAGVLLVILTIVLWLLPLGLFLLMVKLILIPVYKAIVCVAAFAAAPPERRPPRRIVAGLCLLIAVIGVAPIGGALVAREYFVEAFVVRSASMAPTILPGERFLVWKAASYRPRQGDVVLFVRAETQRGKLVKRVAALGGETIELKEGGVYINGSRLGHGALARFHRVPHDYQRFAREGEAFTAPRGSVFLLGDNSRRSLDSRFYGPIPAHNVIGKAYKRYWPLHRAGPIE